jgi:hypothetical protein
VHAMLQIAQLARADCDQHLAESAPTLFAHRQRQLQTQALAKNPSMAQSLNSIQTQTQSQANGAVASSGVFMSESKHSGQQQQLWNSGGRSALHLARSSNHCLTPQGMAASGSGSAFHARPTQSPCAALSLHLCDAAAAHQVHVEQQQQQDHHSASASAAAAMMTAAAHHRTCVSSQLGAFVTCAQMLEALMVDVAAFADSRSVGIAGALQITDAERGSMALSAPPLTTAAAFFMRSPAHSSAWRDQIAKSLARITQWLQEHMRTALDEASRARAELLDLTAWAHELPSSVLAALSITAGEAAAVSRSCSCARLALENVRIDGGVSRYLFDLARWLALTTASSESIGKQLPDSYRTVLHVMELVGGEMARDATEAFEIEKYVRLIEGRLVAISSA